MRVNKSIGRLRKIRYDLVEKNLRNYSTKYITSSFLDFFFYFIYEFLPRIVSSPFLQSTYKELIE